MANDQITQTKIQEVVGEHDIDEQKYQQIMMAYQQDEDFRKKVDTVVQSKTNG